MKLIIIIIALVSIAGGIRSLYAIQSSQALISPIPNDEAEVDSKTSNTAAVTKIFSTNKKDPQELRTKVQETVNNRWKNYSVLVKDFRSDFKMGINETVMYTAASITKIPILIALYYEVEKGNIDLDRDITIQANDIQDYGTGSIRYEKPGSVYSIKTLANLMIKQSDNTAAYVLANHVVGLNDIQDRIVELGTSQTDMVKNDTSNQDMLILLEKLYKGEIVNKAYTQEMLSFMKDTDFEDRLPALLPDNVVVYHKIGDAVGAIHDIGIVSGDTLVYFIGVMTSDITDEVETKKIISEVSKTVYDYMK